MWIYHFKNVFFALLVEINVKKNICPTDKYLYDSLFGSNIRVIFYDLWHFWHFLLLL